MNALRSRMAESLALRADAIRRWRLDPALAPELLVVRCRICGRPIRTTAQDQKRGEPYYLLDLVAEHDPASWQCWECAHAQSRRKAS